MQRFHIESLLCTACSGLSQIPINKVQTSKSPSNKRHNGNAFHNHLKCLCIEDEDMDVICIIDGTRGSQQLAILAFL